MKDLKLSLVVEALDRATAPLRKVGAALGHVRDQTEKLHHAMHKLGLAEFIGGAFFTGAALEAGRAIWELTDHVAEMGEAALINSQKARVSIESFQLWSMAAKQLGVDTDSLTHAFAMMEVHVGGAIKGVKASADALKLVGISVREARQLQKDPGALFQRIIDGYQRIKSPAAAAVAAQGLFSRSWLEMAPLLQAPRDELNELIASIKKSHVVMTDDEAKASHKFEVAKGNMGFAIQGLVNRIGASLIPALTQAVDKVTAWIESLSDDAVKQFADAVSQLATDFVKALPTFQKIIEKSVSLTDKLLKLCGNANAVKWAFIGLGGVLALQGIVGFVQLAGSITTGIFALGNFIKLIFTLIEIAPAAASAMELLDFAMDANPIGVVALAIGLAIAAIAALVYGLWELHKHWADIVSFIEGGCKRIETALAGLESKMPKWLQSLLNAGGVALGVEFPLLGILGKAIDAIAHAPPPSSHPAAGAHAAPLRPISYAGGGRTSAGMLGTIVVQAAPGTRVQRISSTSDIELRHVDRGRIVA